MEYVAIIGNCICCKRIFSYNPHRVPSTSAITGTKEPICSVCIDAINIKRIEQGLPLWPVFEDAYEAIDEGEL
jgi:hypothetical protein